MIDFVEDKIEMKPKQPKIYNPYVEPLLEILIKTTRQNPISKADLYQAMGTFTKGDQRRVQYTVSALTKNYLIGSSSGSHGYFWIHTEEDMRVATKELYARAISSLERAHNIENNWKQEIQKKLIQVEKPVEIQYPEYIERLY